MLQLGQIKLAVLNLFQLVTAQFKVPMDVARENTEAQLDMVSAAGWWGWGGHGDTHVPTSLQHQAPVSAGAALHAGPGCHLC